MGRIGSDTASTAARARGVSAPGDETTGYAHVATWDLTVPVRGSIRPAAIALDWDGTLYVADATTSQIIGYDSSGDASAIRPAHEFYADHGGHAGWVSEPVSLAVDESRRQLYAGWLAYPDQDDPGGRGLGGLIERLPVAGEERTGGSTSLGPGLGFGLGVDRASGRVLASDARDSVRHYTPPSFGVAAVTYLGASDGVNGRIAVLPGSRLAAPDASRSVVRILDYLGAELGAFPVDSGTVLDVAPFDGDVLVLVRPTHPGGTDPALIRFDPDSLAVTGGYTLDELALPAAPQVDWPWDLATSEDGFAVVTGRTNFEVHVFDAQGAPVRREEFGPVEPLRREPHAGEGGSPIALSTTPDGGLDVLVGESDSVVRLEADGTPSTARRVPPDTVDFAPLADGLVLSTASGSLERWVATNAVTPTWAISCACLMGGRITTVGTIAYVARPRDRDVLAVDLQTGASVAHVRLPEAVGLWPADVAASPSGRLLTADLVSSQVQVWLNPDAPEVAWQAGLIGGPRRLTSRSLDDGAQLFAAIMVDGYVEIHETVGGNLLSRWRPVLDDGTPLAPADIALGRNGEVYLAAPDASAIHVFRHTDVVTATPVPNPSATPTPSDKSCRVEGDKVARPSTIVLGDTAAVTLTIAADCPGNTAVFGADIMLVVDKSGSMLGKSIEAARDAATTFVELLDVRYHRVGLTSFSDLATLDVPLTHDPVVAVDGVARLRASGGTNITEGLRTAIDHLDTGGRLDALPVVILLSDGRHGGPVAPGPTAREARNRGVQIYTIGLGDQADDVLLREIAGRDDRYFYAPTPAELFPVYTEILRIVISSLAGNLVINDEMSDFVTYLGGSARPPAVEASGRLSWGRSLLPATGITLTYDIRPLAAGLIPTNRRASADYTDGDGVRRSYEFPVPEILVITPTPTPTPEPRLAFLPIAFKGQCIAGRAHTDVVLLIDTSSSMTGDKLDAARGAARAFLDNVDLTTDQAAVYGFDSDAIAHVGLTRDRAALERAIAGLQVGQGTRIDRALAGAEWELTFGTGRDPTNRGVVVLLSDGAHNGPTADVLTAAASLARHSSSTYAIGLGGDVDEVLLRAVASPGGYYRAPGPDELRGIYETIAVRLPCR
jgi:Mg-chelatase subunit ChlD